MVDVDARLAEIEEMVIRWMAVDDGRRSTIPATPDDVLWLLAVLKEQAEQIERLQRLEREANGTFARGGGEVNVNGLPLTLGQLRHLLYRVFWKQTEGANLNTVPGCEQAASVAADYLSWLGAGDNVTDIERPRFDPDTATTSELGSLPGSVSSVSEASRLLTERDAEVGALLAQCRIYDDLSVNAIKRCEALEAEVTQLREKLANFESQIGYAQEHYALALSEARLREAAEAELARLRETYGG